MSGLEEAAAASARALGRDRSVRTGMFGYMATEERGSKSNPGPVILPTGPTPKGGTQVPNRK
jgi:hypothetical protein